MSTMANDENATSGAERIGQSWNRFWFTPADPSTLSMLRIAIGVIAFYSILTFSFDLERFLSDRGILPIAVVDALVASDAGADFTEPVDRFTYFSYLSTKRDILIAHIAGLCVVAAFAAGLFSQCSSIGALIVFVSYAQRAPMLTSEFDQVAAMLLLYLCVAPCGAQWSIDAWLRRRRKTLGPIQAAQPSVRASVARRLIQLHLALVYLMSAASMLYRTSWWDGTAVGFLATGELNPWIDFRWLEPHYYLVNAWTHLVLLFHVVFPLLVWNRTLRPILLGVSIFIWGSLMLVSGLTTYCLVMTVAGIIYLPANTFSGAADTRAAGGKPAVPLSA